VLAVGVWLGVPWLVNPVLGAAAVAAIYWLGREAYGEPVARGGALLAVASPFLVFMSAEFMNHATALVCLTAFLAGTARLVRRGGGIGTAIVAGLAAGLAAATRSLTALAVVAPAGAWLAWVALRGGRRLLGALLVVGVAAGVPLAGFLAFNHATTGSALTSGYEAKYGPEHNPGFGHSGWGPPHTPAAGALHTASNFNALQKYLFEWPVCPRCCSSRCCS
jgi:4-amino-4-deoxy-L-arabinose transferase-like glycosyltransferase